MIHPQKDFKRLTNSKEFKDWQSSHKDSYLSDFFCIIDEESSDDNLWQVDFYNPDDDTMTSFELPADKRKKCKMKEKESKIFKHENEKVEELSLKKVKMTDHQAIEHARKIMKEQHKHETPTKTILILQNNKDLGKTIWNLTFMTSSLNMFNAKMEASSGDLLESSLKTAMSLKKELSTKEK